MQITAHARGPFQYPSSEPYEPPPLLRSGLTMTLYTALWASRNWENSTAASEPPYRDVYFVGSEGIPLFGWLAIPPQPRGTIIGTYGITGDLQNQWFLRLLGRKAYAQGFAVILFDWRGHGRTAELSPTLTSDGLYEGKDFVQIAAQGKTMDCPPPFWLTGFSLGGQLALWALKAAQDQNLCAAVGLAPTDIRGTAVICPNLDSNRSLSYLVSDPLGRYLERAIARQLKKLARRINRAHPGALDPAAIERANSIRAFDQELVIPRLGFPSVEAYYKASSPLPWLPQLSKPTLILYAADDPLFDPGIIPELEKACVGNPWIDLVLTRSGGHVGYLSRAANQRQLGDPDPWWALNRVLKWCKASAARSPMNF